MVVMGMNWKDKKEGAGWGFILFEDQQVKLVGVRKGSCALSPLHAEVEARPLLGNERDETVWC
ncbi:hypothetical protein HID58_012095 [Brassica napus]|uniref:Uncharacterized protein n=1 Tax=Brassica napus TaxID=3708 RepID=A0ABQ8E047_BRANA|nr:hypothetical protein HID58_012095 [Brassica napus]